MGRNHQIYEIQGIAALDYFDLYRKFTYTNQESYRLDHIAYVELGERKDGNPYETFREWYTKDSIMWLRRQSPSARPSRRDARGAPTDAAAQNPNVRTPS